MSFRSPITQFRSDEDIRNQVQLASTFMSRIEDTVADLQKELKENEQLRLSVFFPAGEIVVESFGYYNPNMVSIKGVEVRSKRPWRVLAHQSAVQILCTIETSQSDTPRRTIGFTRTDSSIA